MNSREVYDLAFKYFHDLGPGMVATMAAIAMAESGGNAAAYNPNGLDRSHGLWQINVHPKANPDLARFNLNDPEQNARAARIILDRQGLQAWTTFTGGAYQEYVGQFYGSKSPVKGQEAPGGSSVPNPEYDRVLDLISARDADNEYLGELLLGIREKTKTPAQALTQLQESGHAPTPDQLSLFGSMPSAVNIINAAIQENDARLSDLYERAYGIDPWQADADIGWRINEETRADLAGMLEGPGSKQFAPAPYQFQVMPNGDIVSFNPNTGTMSSAGNYPGAIDKQVTQDRNGNLVAVDPYTREVTTLQEGFGWPELDPRVKFQTETLLTAAQIEADWAGVELSARGQELEAIAADNAAKIRIGEMVHTEARLNLDRASTALTQRREERQAILDYGVTRESLRTLPSGEVVTRLPFAEQTAAILNTFIPGGGLSASNFELGVIAVNPDQAAADVMNNSAYTSPIPDIISNYQTNKGRTEAVLGNVPQRTTPVPTGAS